MISDLAAWSASRKSWRGSTIRPGGRRTRGRTRWTGAYPGRRRRRENQMDRGIPR